MLFWWFPLWLPFCCLEGQCALCERVPVVWVSFWFQCENVDACSPLGSELKGEIGLINFEHVGKVSVSLVWVCKFLNGNNFFLCHCQASQNLVPNVMTPIYGFFLWMSFSNNTKSTIGLFFFLQKHAEWTNAEPSRYLYIYW